MLNVFLSTSQPHSNVLRPVLHEESDTVTMSEPGSQQEIGQLVTILIQLKYQTLTLDGMENGIEIKLVWSHNNIHERGHRNLMSC